MNFYKPETIKRGVKISQYLKDRGVLTQGESRAVAQWRGGQHFSVSIDDVKGVWHDHKQGDGGDIIKLFAVIEGGDFFAACRTLGDRYNLTPDKVSRKPPKKTRGEILLSQGFSLVVTYTYQNEDGTPRYYVDRYQKPPQAEGEKPQKEFVQRGPTSDNLQGIKRTLYHLPAVIAAQTVHLCEGEKDADTLTRLGLTATTNSGGAKFWPPDFGEFFKDKDVIIHLDNDKAGQERMAIANNVAQFAKTVRILTISRLPKGDVTDWMEHEGGSISELLEAIEAAPIFKAQPKEIADAKLANREPLLNFTEVETIDAKGRTNTKREPRQIDEICRETATRFLGFPRVLGSQLFDFLKDEPDPDKRIMTLDDADALRAWMDGVSKHQSQFQPGIGFVSYRTLLQRLQQTRPRYEVVAKAPWFPARRDAFSVFGKLPPPDPTHSKFEELIAMFNPATPADGTLIRCLYLAPMFYGHCERPAWIVDTNDGQGSGKSKTIEKLCKLYSENPLRFDLETMKFDETKIKKELLSAEGRGKRIVLFDNVTTSFRSPTLASLITSETVSGMRPYGRGHETRINDITWTATSNGASLDTDAAVRYYVIHVAKPAFENPKWEETIDAFIDQNKAQIWADIMDVLEHAEPRYRKHSRFGQFDSRVLSAACRNDDEFAAADARIREASNSANDDADLAAQCVEALTDAFLKWSDSGLKDEEKIRPDLPIALRCSDVDNILRATNGGVRNWTSKTVRRFVNSGLIPNILKGVERVWTVDGRRLLGTARCFIFSPCVENLAKDVAQFVTFSGGIPRRIGDGKTR